MTRENTYNNFSHKLCESTHKRISYQTFSLAINKYRIIKCHNLFMEYDSLLII